jgi:hypothetical protein
MKTGAAIGDITWDACQYCIHCSESNGECEVDDSKWEEELFVDMDVLCCGCYEEEA